METSAQTPNDWFLVALATISCGENATTSNPADPAGDAATVPDASEEAAADAETDAATGDTADAAQVADAELSFCDQLGLSAG